MFPADTSNPKNERSSKAFYLVGIAFTLLLKVDVTSRFWNHTSTNGATTFWIANRIPCSIANRLIQPSFWCDRPASPFLLLLPSSAVSNSNCTRYIRCPHRTGEPGKKWGGFRPLFPEAHGLRLQIECEANRPGGNHHAAQYHALIPRSSTQHYPLPYLHQDLFWTSRCRLRFVWVALIRPILQYADFSTLTSGYCTTTCIENVFQP